MADKKTTIESDIREADQQLADGLRRLADVHRADACGMSRPMGRDAVHALTMSVLRNLFMKGF